MKLLHLIFRKQYINHSTISIPNLVIMKRIEIIIPDSKLEHAHVILKDVNSGGMSAYTVEGSGTRVL